MVKKNFVVKIHKTQDERKMVCITDEEIIGKKFEEGKKQLDFTADFYKGELRSEEDTIPTLKGAALLIFSGKRAVILGKKFKFISKENIITIKGVQQAQCLAF